MVYPDRKVMAICGDGGFMMNSQEMETAVRLGLNLTVLILNDNSYGMIRWKQANMGFEDWGLTYGNPDFVKYAESYGANGHRVDKRRASLPELLRRLPRHARRAPDRLPGRLLRQRPHPEPRDQGTQRGRLRRPQGTSDHDRASGFRLPALPRQRGRSSPNLDLEVTDKYTGKVATRVALADAATIDAGIAAAVEAAEPMARLAAYERQDGAPALRRPASRSGSTSWPMPSASRPASRSATRAARSPA